MNKCLECGKETNNPKFCSMSCSGKYNGRIRKRKSISKYYKNPNFCKKCGKVINIKGSIRDTKRKVFCSQTCSSIYNNRKRESNPEKFCIVCSRKINKGSKLYCSQECYNKDRKRIFIEKWLSGKISGTTKTNLLSKTIRDYLLNRANYKCEQCGWNKTNFVTGKVPLQIDHIDGNYKNNRPENLRVLCPNCHSLTPTYGSLNKGSGRDSR